MSTEETNNGIRKVITKSVLTVEKVYKGDYQKDGTLTAQIRQTITTDSYYPGKSVTNDHQDNIFSSAEFNFEEKEYQSVENRLAWIDVPEGSTIESSVSYRSVTCFAKWLSSYLPSKDFPWIL